MITSVLKSKLVTTLTRITKVDTELDHVIVLRTWIV